MPSTQKPRLSAVVGTLTAVNVLTSMLGFVTGPLLAHALGAHGRGDLAAITVPLFLAPQILGFALPGFANREVARGGSVREVLGSAGAPLVALGLVSTALAFPAAAFLAEGRETVRVWLIVVFAAMPLWLITNLIVGCLQGLESWRRVMFSRVIAMGVPTLGIAILFVTDDLNVGSAAAVTLAGWALAILPGATLLLSRGAPVFKRSLAREGLVFGGKSWFGGLAYLANLRLDQLVMITAVAPRELGLYAVATTIAGLPTLLVGGVTPPLMARVASGQLFLVPQALRITLLATFLVGIALAPLTPLLLLVVFSQEFVDATWMTIMLLGATLPFAGGSVLATALQADGAPGIPSIAELIALAITLPGLALLLGPLGGLGAAIVSLAAYSASFVFQLVALRRRESSPLREYLVPSRADLRWARELSARLPGRIASRVRPRRSAKT